MARLGFHIAAPVAIGVLILTACAPTATPRPTGGSEQAPTRAAQAPTQLVVAVRGEPPSIASKPVVDFTNALARPSYLFNANLDLVDERERP
jgi:hypothetical protein